MERSAHLSGLAQVASYTGYSEATLRKHKLLFPKMPINKIDGRWVGNRVKLSCFYNDLAAGQENKYR